MKTQFLTFFSLLLSCALSCSAQTKQKEELSAELRSAIEQPINDLQEYISQIGNKSLSDEQRQTAIEMAIDLFAKDIMVGKERRQPYIQINRRNGTIKTIPIKAYFNSLLGIRFDKVEIVDIDLIAISDLEKSANGEYSGIVTEIENFKPGDKQIVFNRRKMPINIPHYFEEKNTRISLKDITVKEYSTY